MRKHSQAAIDLGLVPPPESDRTIDAFQLRVSTLLVDIQINHGAAEAAALFERMAALAQAMTKTKRKSKQAPPRKRKGSHDPNADKNLLALWRNTPHATKSEFARELIDRKLVRRIEPNSLVRQLNRLLHSQGGLRQDK